MKKLILLLALFACQRAHSQAVQVLSFTELNKIINQPDGRTKVINFWATWCTPCVAELPYFVQASENDGYKNIDFIFVSVDFQSQHQKVIDKVKQLKMKGTLVQLNEQGGDWIEQMDPQWQGAIPYTILIPADGNRSYHYDAFENFDALKTFIDTNYSN